MKINEDSLMCVNSVLSSDIQSAKEAVLEILINREVVEINFMSNFGWDKDAELFFGYPIVRGLVVTVPTTFQCNMADKLWIHPLMNKERVSCTSPPSLQVPGEYGDVVGTYVNGTGMSFDGSMVNLFITDRVQSVNNREDILCGNISLCDSVQPVSIVNKYNDIRTDGRNIHIFNHVCRVANGSIMLIAHHPMRGFIEVVASEDTNIPVDFGLCGRIAWSNITPAYVNALYSKCVWNGDIPYNIHVMRNMIELSPKNTAKWCNQHKCFIANNWITEKVLLSTNDVRYKLTPKQAVELIPPIHFSESIPKMNIDEFRIPVSVKKLHEFLEKYDDIKQQFPNFQLFHSTILGQNDDFVYFSRDVLDMCNG